MGIEVVLQILHGHGTDRHIERRRLDPDLGGHIEWVCAVVVRA